MRLQYSRRIVLEQCRVVWANFSASTVSRERDLNLLNLLINKLSSGRDNFFSYFSKRVIFTSLGHESVLFSMRLVGARSVEPFNRNP